ncbi:MAG: hypothetical protein EOP04_03260 [Proteobacteria bacterium]|nr:MAG: hypothetical protein EOP04_03260 [Pseudomonadota bacterium]
MRCSASFAPSIVQGKGYDTQTSEGAAIWEQLQERLLAPFPAATSVVSEVAIQAAKFGKPHMVTPRLGQGGFRVAVTESYLRRCAMTGE